MVNREKTFSLNILFSDTAGFVYGAKGFVDRAFGGITILVIQIYSPTIPEHPELEIQYFRWALVFANGGLIGVAIILTIALLLHKKECLTMCLNSN